MKFSTVLAIAAIALPALAAPNPVPEPDSLDAREAAPSSELEKRDNSIHVCTGEYADSINVQYASD